LTTVAQFERLVDHEGQTAANAVNAFQKTAEPGNISGETGIAELAEDAVKFTSILSTDYRVVLFTSRFCTKSS